MSDLTAAAIAWRAERDRQERAEESPGSPSSTRRPRQQSEDDYNGAQAPSAPVEDETATEEETGEFAELPVISAASFADSPRRSDGGS